MAHDTIPREYLESHTIAPQDVESEAYRAWVKNRVQLARAYFKAGQGYLAQAENPRCRLADYAYVARFEGVLDAIEREGYRLRPKYQERKSLGAVMRMIGSAFGATFNHRPPRLVPPASRSGNAHNENYETTVHHRHWRWDRQDRRRGAPGSARHEGDRVRKELRAWRSLQSLHPPRPHFDTGPTLFIMPLVYEAEFEALGASMNELLDLRRVDPTYHLVFDDGSQLALTSDLKSMQAQLESLEPGSFEGFRRYLDEGHRQPPGHGAVGEPGLPHGLRFLRPKQFTASVPIETAGPALPPHVGLLR